MLRSDQLRIEAARRLDELRATTADLLDYLAEQSDEPRFRSAAALVRGSPAGRRKVDDAKALTYAETLLSAGLADSINDAAAQTAKFFAPLHQVDTFRDRIRRKLRTKLNNSKDSGPQPPVDSTGK